MAAPPPSSQQGEAVATSPEKDGAREDTSASAPEIPIRPKPGPGNKRFDSQLLDFVEEMLHRSVKSPPQQAPATATRGGQVLDGYSWALKASPLWADLSTDERVALLQGLKLRVVEPGDIVITEGEASAGLFTVASGSVNVFVRNPAGHNIEIGHLAAGDFFGEIATLSGKPRNATVVAAESCELLVFDRDAIDSAVQDHDRTWEILKAFYVQRKRSPEVAAVRAMPTADQQIRSRAQQILQARFGTNTWDPRMRLRLADLLAKAGKRHEALPILVDLADSLARENLPEKTIAVLKKIELLRRRGRRATAPQVTEEGQAADARTDAEAQGGLRPPAPKPPPSAPSEDHFAEWFGDFVHKTVREGRSTPTAARRRPSASSRVADGYVTGVRSSPLLASLDEDELLALIQGVRLITFGPGEIVLTEGERGESVFILAAGSVKVSVRNLSGADVGLCTLPEGSFVGEIAALSGGKRCATVTTAEPAELLELDKATLDGISTRHPRVRQVLEAYYAERAGSSEAAAIRTQMSSPDEAPAGEEG